jgi:FAD/FMN-containing dehydrogenase/Fe-S oxidoreductase
MNHTPEKITADLEKFVQGSVHGDILHRAAYSIDAGIYRILPTCVVVPLNTSDIIATVKYAASNNIPIAPRGAASGVAGESLCSGIVFDMTQHMNQIVSIEDDGKSVTCQPGLVLDDLNDRLAQYNRKIGPDPSSSNRATVGGCVANNATGAHSLEYGYMADHVKSIKAVLPDGSEVEFTNDYQCKPNDDQRIAQIARDCLAVLKDKEDIISQAMPKSKRNRSGYSITDICKDGKIDLARLLVGSEGTLAIFTEITLNTVPENKAKALLQLEFDSLDSMAKAVPIIVDTGASACELMDQTLISMAYDAFPHYRDVLSNQVAATLLVEHTGQSDIDVKQRIEKTDSAVGQLAMGRQTFFQGQKQKRLWKLRKDAAPLLNRQKGSKQAIPFIEDVAVDNLQLGQYITGMLEIGQRYDFEMSFYGHAGDGELHIRPFLDLNKTEDVEKLRSIINDVFTFAWSLNGSISGEHADGIIRAPFIKSQYGDEFYDLLRAIKKIFDPAGLMNPGKIITDETNVITENLKAQFKPSPEGILENIKLQFEKDELTHELEKCSGCGLCLTKDSQLRICPAFRALGEELASPRAKANILHLWMSGQLKAKDFQSPQFKQFLSLCINCKACSLQCPCGVDVSKLINVARAEYAAKMGLALPEILMSHNRSLSIMGTIFNPLSNYVMSLPIFKTILEKLAGIDSRRNLPKFEKNSFIKVGSDYLASLKPISNPLDKVTYFVDTYANYNDHSLGFAVLNVLRQNNIEVTIQKQWPVPLPAIAYGDTKIARRYLALNVEHMAKLARRGYKIICSEPSAALCLQQDLRHYIATDDAKLVADNTFELMDYLLNLYNRDDLKNVTTPIQQDFAYHLPCHLCVTGASSSIELLSRLCNINIVELQAGCCGLAGTFGMQKKNYDLSDKIATNLANALNATETKNVLTECSACKMQIEHISDKTVTHPIKILAQAYNT